MPAGITARLVAAEYESARSLIFAFKFDRNRRVGRALAQAMADALHGNPFARQAGIVIPVPIHRRRARDRGFNQADLLAEGLADALGIPWRNNVLVRHRPTPPQTEMESPEDRARNVADAFRVAEPVTVAGETVLLVDDIITTGATVSACAGALLEAGASAVVAAAVAHPFPKRTDRQ